MNTEKLGFFKKYSLDIVVVSVLLLISLLILGFVLLLRTDGETVTVEVDGVTVGEYSLSVDAVYELNNGTNTLVIEDGKAYMKNTACPDHTCEKTGKIYRTGETIVCLPNKIIVKVNGKAQDNDVDIVS